MGVYSTSVGGGSAALGCEWWGGLTIPTKLIQSHLLASLRRFFVLQPEVKMLVFLLLYTQAHRPNDQRFRPLNLFLSLLIPLHVSSSSPLPCLFHLWQASKQFCIPLQAFWAVPLCCPHGLLGCTAYATTHFKRRTFSPAVLYGLPAAGPANFGM